MNQLIALGGIALLFGLTTLSTQAENEAVTESFPLVDGTTLEGRLKSFTDDDAIIVVHEKGVRRIPLTQVKDPKKTKLRTRHSEMIAEAARETAAVVQEAANLLADEITDSVSDSLDEHLKPCGDEWILGVGIVVIAIGVIMMFIASFAENPIWGLCFFLTSGLSWLAFFFLCFRRAWSPTLVTAAGTAMVVFFVYLRASQGLAITTNFTLP